MGIWTIRIDFLSISFFDKYVYLLNDNAMNSTTEIRLYELLKTKFSDSDSQELVKEIKSMTQDDLAERIESKIISALTWRLLFFFIAQVGFTIGLIKLINI